jgi:hypothetical protein
MNEPGFLMNRQRDLPGGIPTLNDQGTLKDEQMPKQFQRLIAEADENILIGQPLYLKQNGHLGLASGNENARSRICGLALSNTLIGHACSYTSFGNVQRNDWSAICSDVLLKTSQTYYLDANLGKITNIPPETGYLVEIGEAVNNNAIALNIKQSILM